MAAEIIIEYVPNDIPLLWCEYGKVFKLIDKDTFEACCGLLMLANYTGAPKKHYNGPQVYKNEIDLSRIPQIPPPPKWIYGKKVNKSTRNSFACAMHKRSHLKCPLNCPFRTKWPGRVNKGPKK